MSKRPDYALMPCTYCGEVSEALDHVEPYSATGTYGKRHQRSWAKRHVVPSCAECNHLLSNLNFVSIAERAAYLAKKYKDRYKKILSLPSWGQEELAELRPNLRKIVIRDQKKKKTMQRRIKNCKEISGGDLTALQVWENWDKALEAGYEPHA